MDAWTHPTLRERRDLNPRTTRMWRYSNHTKHPIKSTNLNLQRRVQMIIFLRINSYPNHHPQANWVNWKQNLWTDMWWAIHMKVWVWHALEDPTDQRARRESMSIQYVHTRCSSIINSRKRESKRFFQSLFHQSLPIYRNNSILIRNHQRNSVNRVGKGNLRWVQLSLVRGMWRRSIRYWSQG